MKGGGGIKAPVVTGTADAVEKGADSATSMAQAVRETDEQTKQAKFRESALKGTETLVGGLKTGIGSRFGPAGEMVGDVLDQVSKPIQKMAAHMVADSPLGKAAMKGFETIDKSTGGMASRGVEGIGTGVSTGAGVVKGVTSGDVQGTVNKVNTGTTALTSQMQQMKEEHNKSKANATTAAGPAAKTAAVNVAPQTPTPPTSTPTPTQGAGGLDVGKMTSGITEMLGSQKPGASGPATPSSGTGSGPDIGSLIGGLTDALGKSDGPSSSKPAASGKDLGSLIGSATKIVGQAEGLSSKDPSKGSSSGIMDTVKTLAPQATQAATKASESSPLKSSLKTPDPTQGMKTPEPKHEPPKLK